MDALKTMPESEAFQVMLRYFLKKNGHRGLKELDLQSPRWEENPIPILGMIRNAMLTETDPAEHESNVTQTRSDLETEIKNSLAVFAGERCFHFRFWYTLRTAYPAVIRRILFWILLCAGFAWLLGDGLRPAYFWGFAAYVGFYGVSFWGYQLLFRRNIGLLGIKWPLKKEGFKL